MEPLLEAHDVSKSYGPVLVLSGVTMDVLPGEVHAVIGENGAGKSTLIRILSGLFHADSGTVRLKGRPITFSSPHDALLHGIGTVHQEFTQCPQLSVTENLFLGRRLPKNRLGLVDWAKAEHDANSVLDTLGVKADVRQPIGELSVATCKMVEISRVLVHSSDVLILDEPTAALDLDECSRLFDVIGRLLERGVGVIYVSHRLEEVRQISSRVSVLRDGLMVATCDSKAIDIDEMVSLMVGRRTSALYPPRTQPVGDEVGLEVRDLAVPGHFTGVSFSVRQGEIFGIAGLDGSGRSGVAQAIGGGLHGASGTIWRGERQVGPVGSVWEGMKAGIGYVPPERQGLGLHLPMSISNNIAMPQLRRLQRGPFLNGAGEAALVEKYVNDLQIRCESARQPCTSLSGGNQQKVLLAKWISTDPEVLVLNEPTRGVDVGAKLEIHRIIRGLAAEGLVTILASSDLPELMGMCDRILVMRAGEPAGIFDPGATTAEQIGLALAHASGKLEDS